MPPSPPRVNFSSFSSAPLSPQSFPYSTSPPSFSSAFTPDPSSPSLPLYFPSFLVFLSRSLKAPLLHIFHFFLQPLSSNLFSPFLSPLLLFFPPSFSSSLSFFFLLLLFSCFSPFLYSHLSPHSLFLYVLLFLVSFFSFSPPSCPFLLFLLKGTVS